MLKKYQAILLVLIAYITIFAFYPSIKADFTCVDDCILVNNNPYITSISLEYIKKTFTSYYFKLYHPIVTLSYMIEYHFFQQDPYIYHLDNLLLHLFNVFLVFFIFKSLTKSLFISYLVAILFAIHPTRVETVFWVSSRKDTMYSIFYLLSIFLYIKNYGSKYSKLFISLSLIFFILSCMSKPMAVTLPVILILIDFVYYEFNIKKVLKYVPFMLIAIIFSFVTTNGYYTQSQKETYTLYVRAIDFVCANYNVLFYLKELIFPTSSFIHPQFFDHSLLLPNNILYSTSIVFLLTFFSIYSLKFTKKIFFGFILFLVVLLPSSGILQTGMSPVTDRYIYLAYIGLFYIFAELIVFCYTKFKINKKLVILFCISLIILLFYLTYNRTLLWTDNNKLVATTIEKYPNTASHAYLIQGCDYKNAKDYDKAMDSLQKSFAIDKSTTYIHFNLGHLYQLMGKYEEALKYYSKISKISTEYIAVVNNVAIMKKEQGNIDKAISLIEKSLKNREVVEDYIFYTLAVFCFEQKDFDKAVEAIKNAIKRNPLNDSYYLFLFDIYKKQNNFDGIEELLSLVIKNKIKNSNFFDSVGVVYFEKGNYEKSKDMFYLAIENNPKDSVAYFFLGNMFALKNGYRFSVICYTLAILYSNNSNAKGEYYFKRAVAWSYLGKYNLALKDINKSIENKFDVPVEFKNDLNIKIKGDSLK